MQLFVDEVNVRAWPGGAGDSKVGANYAPTIVPQAAAFQRYGTAQARRSPSPQPHPNSHGPSSVACALSSVNRSQVGCVHASYHQS